MHMFYPDTTDEDGDQTLIQVDAQKEDSDSLSIEVSKTEYDNNRQYTRISFVVEKEDILEMLNKCLVD